MTESELIDKVLEDAKNCSAVSVRSTPEDYDQALASAKQWGLINRPEGRGGYCLSDEGRLALNYGGFDKWLSHKKQKEIPRHSINIGGSVTSSQIGQDSFFRDLTVDHKTIPAPSAQEKQQNIKSSNGEKVTVWVLSIIGAIIAGVILLFIEYKTGFFSGK